MCGIRLVLERRKFRLRRGQHIDGYLVRETGIVYDRCPTNIRMVEEANRDRGSHSCQVSVREPFGSAEELPSTKTDALLTKYSVQGH